jgi:hypothetical protein
MKGIASSLCHDIIIIAGMQQLLNLFFMGVLSDPLAGVIISD